MAQKTAKRRYISAILSAIGQPQRFVGIYHFIKRHKKSVQKILDTIIIIKCKLAFQGQARCQKSLVRQVLLIFRNCITRAILKLVADRESAVYSSVNEHFKGKPDAQRALLDNFLPRARLNRNNSIRTAHSIITTILQNGYSLHVVSTNH